ncbi:MAG: 50S ribosomal protein L3 [Candidatus Andersenbacteria bacterium]
MKALLGRKVGMSQMFSPEGEVVPVTLVVAEPNDVTLRREEAKDGYTAVQLGLPSPKSEPDHKVYDAHHEFQAEIAAETTSVTVDQFVPGDVVTISATSKGKGFQGVVKRHHFKGGPKSHGHTDWERKAGSIGQRFPQHTMKGRRMAGHMGDDRVTVKNLTVVSVDPTQNLLAIKGAVPGRRGTIVEIRTSEA